MIFHLNESDIGTHERNRHEVALNCEILIVGQHDRATHAEPTRRGGRESGVIRLRAPARDEVIRPLCPRMRDLIFEFARLVATQRQIREIVALEV